MLLLLLRGGLFKLLLLPLLLLRPVRLRHQDRSALRVLEPPLVGLLLAQNLVVVGLGDAYELAVVLENNLHLTSSV